MNTTHAWVFSTVLTCTACGAGPAPTPPVAPQPQPQPQLAAPVPVAEVDAARTAFECASHPASPACVAIADFAAGHAPAAPAHGRAYVGLMQCPPGALPPDLGVAGVLAATTRDGELALHYDATRTTNDVIDALSLALRTPGTVPADPEAQRIYESATVAPMLVDELATLPIDASLDARTLNAWMVREHEGNLYELDRARADGQLCIITFRPVADVEVLAPPTTADADVVAFLNTRWSDIEAVAARAFARCAAHQSSASSADELGESPAQGTPVAGWPETLGVVVTCARSTPTGGVTSDYFLPLGHADTPAPPWAYYGRDGARARCELDDGDCSNFRLIVSEPHLVSARVARPLPSGSGWVTVEVLMRR